MILPIDQLEIKPHIKTLKVRCSARHNMLSAEDCLACTRIEEHPPCHMDYGLLLALYSDPPRPDIHVTDLTGCLLKSWYSKKSPPAEYPHKMLARFNGTLFHASVETSDEHCTSELPLSWEGVVGTSDRVYKNGRIVDYKSAASLYPELLPYGSHAMQLNIYAHMLRQMGHPVTSLAIQYVCLGGPKKCLKHREAVEWRDGALVCPTCGKTPKNAHQGVWMVEVPMWDAEQVEATIRERRDVLAAALSNGHKPDAEPSWLCKYCEVECGAGLNYLSGGLALDE